ncbi:MAG: hypothetical protein GY842_19330 [bacterium]|nr:hypothetical protein [bacterium]
MSRLLAFVGILATALPGPTAWCQTEAASAPVVVVESASEPIAPPPAPVAEEEAAPKPRFELHVPSLHGLLTDARRSHSGPFIEHLGRLLTELGSSSAEGVDVEGASSVLAQVKAWPDTSVEAMIFAADNEGLAQWAVQLDWPLKDLHTRLQPLLTLEAAETLFAGITLTARPEGGYVLALPGTTLAYLLPVDDARSVVASHPDLELPEAPFRGTEETEKTGASLLVCRLNLQGTEKDSGATFWSSLSALTDAVYAMRVNETGEWVEQINVHWPPGVGMLAKAALGKVKQTFFVPDEAFGGFVFDAVSFQAMLDGIAGFGPQMMMDGPGRVTMVGEVETGPIASNTGSAACLTLLPGTGFAPIPDLVFQLKTQRAEKLIEDIREATKKSNKLFRDREQPEPWHEAEVKDRPIFWSDSHAVRGGSIMPFVNRPVLFITKEVDAKGRERDFLVVGMTTSSPKRLVRRWVESPRPKERRYLPDARKPHGEVWINWQQAYRLIQPYVNLSLAVISRDLLLPRMKDLQGRLTDAALVVKVRYSGIEATHRGPIPAGVIALPTLFGLATTETRGTDLARERSACRTLKVFHHHAELFKKDLGRWPAELAELDGYVDFAGHPYLLDLDLSAKKRRSDWLGDIFGDGDEDEEDGEEEEFDDEDDGMVDIDDDLFVIDWGREAWTLGIAPDTFEHLEQLYIDQDGKIHRVEKKPAEEPLQ